MTPNRIIPIGLFIVIPIRGAEFELQIQIQNLKVDMGGSLG